MHPRGESSRERARAPNFPSRIGPAGLSLISLNYSRHQSLTPHSPDSSAPDASILRRVPGRPGRSGTISRARGHGASGAPPLVDSGITLITEGRRTVRERWVGTAAVSCLLTCACPPRSSRGGRSLWRWWGCIPPAPTANPGGTLFVFRLPFASIHSPSFTGPSSHPSFFLSYGRNVSNQYL